MAAQQPQRSLSQKLEKSIVTKKDFHTFNSTASGIRGVIDTMHTKLKTLDGELRADEYNRLEFQKQLLNLRNQRDDLRKRLEDRKEWLERFEKQIGPFSETYDKNTASIGGVYGNARKHHQKGMQMLMDEFGYHPLYKKTGDTFNAVPFVPKRL